MTEFLVKHFVKDYKDVEKVSVRTAYGVLASIVGIFCNVFLFAVKFTVGLVLGSVSVTADAFNNLSDAGSSVIGFVGVKMAEKPADADHPFGHGRMEYIAALVVSFLVIEVGFTFLKDSVGRIRNPEEMSFSAVSVCILLLSIAVKLWLGLFNRKLGERIDSKVMKAVFTDAMGDVVTTGATIFFSGQPGSISTDSWEPASPSSSCGRASASRGIRWSRSSARRSIRRNMKRSSHLWRAMTGSKGPMI